MLPSVLSDRSLALIRGTCTVTAPAHIYQESSRIAQLISSLFKGGKAIIVYPGATALPVMCNAQIYTFPHLSFSSRAYSVLKESHMSCKNLAK